MTKDHCQTEMMSTIEMDCDRSKHRTSKFLSVAGCMMLLLPTAFDLYWGNASIYVLSFMASRLEPASEFLTTTSISLHLVVVNIAVLGCGFLTRRVNTGIVIILGVILCNFSTFLSYFAVQHSMGMLNLTVGALLGAGSGILYSCTMKIVVEHAQGDEGFLCAFLLVAFSIGASINCQIITWYVNPENENPNLKIGSFTVFTNKDIIDRVPSMFLFLGGFMLIVQVVGMLVLLVSSRMISRNKTSDERRYLKSQNSSTETIDTKTPGSTIDIDNKYPMTSKVGTGANQKTPDSQPPESKEGMKTRSRDADNLCVGNDSTPNEMLRNPAFYSCWLSMFMAEFSSNAISNLYKLYGLQWIPDDHFLAIIGSLNTPAVAVFRVLCGATTDRFGPKISIIGVLMSIVVLGAWFFFTPMVSRWMYMFFTLAYVGVNGAMLAGTSGSIVHLFGKTHFSTNIGYALTSVIASNIIAPFVIAFLRNFGWFTIFAGTSGMNILSICFCLKFFPSRNP